MKYCRIVVVLCLLVMVISCNRSKLKVNLSEVDVDQSFYRIEKKMFDDNSVDKWGKLSEEHDDFMKIFSYKMLKIDGPNDTVMLNKFVGDKISKEVITIVDSVFHNFSPIEKEISEAFRHYKYHFPEREVPDVYTCISGFNQSIVLSNELVGISLEKYIGNVGESYYTGLRIPRYKQRNMNPQKIPSDVMLGWAYSEFAYNDSVDNLLNQMIYHGKIMYFVDAMMPTASDTIKIGYTQRQLDFCRASEPGFWTFFVEQKLLYSTDSSVKRAYINHSPFTSSFTQKSPGRTGVWIGWQIVRSYMNKNPEVSLRQLMRNDDYQMILNDSNYSPHY